MPLQALAVNCKRWLMKNGSQEQGESERQTLQSFLWFDRMEKEGTLDHE